jgi:hypothetical protein
MASARVPAADTGAIELASFLRLYERHLRAANRAETTIYKYLLAARQLIAFLEDAGMPTTATGVHRGIRPTSPLALTRPGWPSRRTVRRRSSATATARCRRST